MHKMLTFLLISLLCVATSGLKAVPFGETRSAKTLFPYPASSTIPSPYEPKLIEHDYTEPENPLPQSIEEDQTIIERLELSNESLTTRGFKLDNHFHDKNGDNWGSYVPVGLDDEKTQVRRAGPKGGLKQAPAYGGVIQMDCMKAPEVCKNAGFYQNCIRGAKGDYRKVLYTNGPLEDDDPKKTPVADTARFNSGVSTSWSTPCRAWPFAQRFWHPQETPQNPFPKSGLETDEWPMATMVTGPFGNNNPNHPISLRCMTHDKNTAGSREVMAFRRPENPNYVGRGKWKKWRLGPEEPLLEGDTYNVNFNFDSFPKQGAKDYKVWAGIRSTLKYAEWTKKSDCDTSDDLLQFYMSNLRSATNKKKSGKMSSPYDVKKHNTYRLASETQDIRQFHVTLTITGKAQDQIKAKIWEFYDGKELVLDTKDTKIKPGGSFDLQGKLPKALTIEKQKNGCEYEFTYAQKSDGARWISFSTRDEGFGLAKFKAKTGETPASQTEKYCDESTLTGNNPGTVLECSFPGW